MHGTCIMQVRDVEIAKKTRLELVREAASNRENCICEQPGLWLVLAIDVLSKNGIDHMEFSDAVYDLLDGGIQKHKNIILVGERNCAKTFLLEPLSKIFEHISHSTSIPIRVDGSRDGPDNISQRLPLQAHHGEGR